MSAIGIIIAVAVLKVLLSILSARSAASGVSNAAGHEDTDAFNSLSALDEHHDRDVLPVGNIDATPYIEDNNAVPMYEERSAFESTDGGYTDSWSDASSLVDRY